MCSEVECESTNNMPRNQGTDLKGHNGLQCVHIKLGTFINLDVCELGVHPIQKLDKVIMALAAGEQRAVGRV